MESLIRDVRHAARALWKRPGFTAVAVLTLALGIGANAAIFTVYDRALLRPLPVDAPDRLVLLTTLRGGGDTNWNFSYPAFRDYRERSDALSGLLAFAPRDLTLTTTAASRRIDGALVSANYFDLLGVRPARGRGFLPGEDRAPVAVLSHSFWQDRFGGDPAVVGRAVTLNERSFRIVGVAPERFRGLRRGTARDVWVPIGMQAQLGGREGLLSAGNARWLYLMGRLEPGVGMEPAQASMSQLFRRLEEAAPSGEAGIALRAGGRGFATGVADYERPLAVLMVAVGLVLLIACANVANLLLARARTRRRELAVRRSLGASRGRLVRQLLTESGLLAALGGAAGLLLASWMADLLVGFRPVLGGGLAFDTGPDARVLGFTLGVSTLAVVVAGVVPALRASRPELVPALKGGGGSASSGRGRGRPGLRGTFVVAQVALSLAVLVGAGLLVRSLWNLHAADVGFRASGLLLASVDLGGGGYDAESGSRFYADLLERMEALPGVRSASLATTVTPSPAGSRFEGLRPEGYEPAPDEAVEFDVNQVGPEYFRTLGMSIVRGRGILEGDREGARTVAVVNERIARRYWPGDGALGKRIFLGDGPDAPAVTVVGVARDGRYRGVREEGGLMLYLPLGQVYDDRATLLVRTAGDPLPLVDAVRREVRALDPVLPVYDVRTMREHIDRVLSRDRMLTTVMLLFGLLALALSALGVYGVMAYVAVRRAREIGIRVALGARPGEVLRMILSRSARLVAAGLALGAAAAIATGRMLSSLLYGVDAADPATFATIAALLGAVALVAAYIPARGATRVDPMTVLRNE